MMRIDLMPESCRLSLGRRTAVRRWAVIYLGALTLVAGSYFAVRAQAAPRERERADLARQVQENLDRNEEIQRLRKEKSEIESAMRRYDLLAWPVRVSDVIGVLGAEMPGSVTLTSMTLTPRRETQRGPGRSRRSEESKTYLSVEVEGISPSDLDLAGFVSGLDAHDLFDKVALDYARSREVDGVPARGFRLTCEIDLSRRFEFVDAADGGGVGGVEEVAGAGVEP